MRKSNNTKKSNKPDRTLFIITILLTVAGLIAVADASSPIAIRDFADKFFFVKQQIGWALLGLLLMLIFMQIKYTFWEKIATPLFFGSLFLMLLVFIPGLGVSLLGAKRWIVIGSYSFQPSELLKLTLAVYLAKLAANNKKTKAFYFPLIISAGLIMLQPDLGTTVVIAGMAMLQILLAGIPLGYYFLSLGGGLIAGIILILISPYRRDRLLTYLQMTVEPLDKSYHIRQILLALGSGGLFGVGLGHSRQKYLFLPETATDSIFAVIAEEIGFLGAKALLMLLVIYVYKGLKIAATPPDKFSYILAAGITSWVAVQTILNIGSMVALVPLTGIPLPFISYGGTALTAILAGSGILLNISKYKDEK